MVALVTVIIPTYGKILKEHNSILKTLNSLKKIKDSNFRVIILNTSFPFDSFAEKVVAKHIKEFKKFFPIMSVSESDLKKINNYIKNKGFGEELKKHINFSCYSNFRNFGLIVANILKSELVLMIDDDEIITGSNFLDKVREGIGGKFQGKKILGKTGYYLHKNSYKFEQKSRDIEKLWPSAYLFNKVILKFLKNKNRYNSTSVALGGIMVFSDKLFEKIPFDPYCLRGEDVSYAASCKEFSCPFVFDKELKIVHYPPLKGVKYYQSLNLDIYRFLYERERIYNFKNVVRKDLLPYPGFFLGKDLEKKATKLCSHLVAKAIKNHDKTYLGYIENFKTLFYSGPKYAIFNKLKYKIFQKQWKQLMKEIRKSKELFKHFNRF